MTERDIFLGMLDLPDPAARAAYLDTACGSDSGLRARVEALIRSHDAAGSFLGTPVVAATDLDPAATRAFAGAAGSDVESTRTSEGAPSPGSDDETLSFLSPPRRSDSLGRIGHYEVLEVLGRGAFGVVFRAFDDTLQRVVAVKVLAPQMAATSPARKRFLREARSSAQVRHENVVQVHAVEEQPLPYLVMEFIPGETLQQRLDRTGPLDVPEVLRIGRQIAEGLTAAHAQGLIHRDIKPANVLIDGGPQQRVKITDFGLARAADDASISQSGVVAGTPMYMAPEQAKGESLDNRADLFSLGSVLYVMCTGRPPFRASGTMAVLKRVCEDNPRPIREVIPEIPEWLCRVVEKLHAKDPTERFQSAREVADVLTDCEKQLQTHGGLRDYSRIPGGKLPRQSRRWKWAVAALFLPLIALGVYALTQPNPLRMTLIEREPDSDDAGWVQLFNGRDQTGWKPLREQPGTWGVVNGLLQGSGGPGHLYSERGDYANFRLRLEAVVNEGGDSEVKFRSGMDRVVRPGTSRNPSGYVVSMGEGLGTISFRNPQNSATTGFLSAAENKPNQWFTLEIIAEGNHLITKVNGSTTADWREPLAAYQQGHLVLQVWDPKTVIHFRKIEIKELPPSTAGSPPLAIAPFDAEKAKAHQEAWAKYLHLPAEFTNNLGMKFRLIPPGEFTMGNADENPLAQPEDKPQHKVRISKPLYLGVHEVTVGQFRAFVSATKTRTFAETDPRGAFMADATGYHRVPGTNWRAPGYPQTDDFPVTCVTWTEAAAFCEWLSHETGEMYRLPTDAEWESACRAGTTTSYNFGTKADPSKAAIQRWDGQGGPVPVGSFPANFFGVKDMHGNVYEWCLDGRRPYTSEAVTDPVGPTGPRDNRVRRGGAWSSELTNKGILSAGRHAGPPEGEAGQTVGFRVAIVGDLKTKRSAPFATGP
jgi:serine/threonine protein kinase/formylglycine-generating enzyme required for sulfatase activity